MGDAVKEEKIDISVLFNEDTTDETKEKVRAVFEAAVGAAAADLLAQEAEEREAAVIEHAEAVGEELTEAADEYMDYVAERWLEENKIAVESAFEVERARSLMESLLKVVAEHGMEIPEGGADVFQDLMAMNEDLHERLNEAHAEIMALRALVEERDLDEAVEEVAEGLKDTQRVKLTQLAEEIRYTDVEDFKRKLVAVKESFFKDTVKKPDDVITEVAETPPPAPKVDDKRYVPIGDSVVDAINAAFTSRK